MDPTTRNKIENLIKTAKKERSALIIRERDKWFAERHVKRIMDAYPCTGILVKSTQPGTAYYRLPEDMTDETDVAPADLLPAKTMPYGNDVIYATAEYGPKHGNRVRLAYGKGALLVLDASDGYELLIRPEQVTFIENMDDD